MSSQLIYEPGLVDYPERLKAFFSLIDFYPQKTVRISDTTPPQKEPKENLGIPRLLRQAAFLSQLVIKRIQRNSYFADPNLLLESDMPRFSAQDRFSMEGSYIFPLGYPGPVPFADVAPGQALWTEKQLLPFETPVKEKKSDRKRRKLVRRLMSVEFVKAVKEVATPKQWQIARRFFIYVCFQEGRTPLKDMAAELGIPSSTFSQQLWGRPRNLNWIGGVFPKAIKKMRKNPEVLILIRKEKRLLNAVIKELLVKKDSKDQELVKGAAKERKDNAKIEGGDENGETRSS